MQPRIVKHRWRWTGTLVAVLSVLFLAACGGDDDGGDDAAATDGEQAAATNGEEVQVGFFKVGPNSFIEAAIEEAEEVAEEDGNATLTVLDPGFDATEQASQIQDAVTTQRFDAMLVQPLDSPGIVPFAKEAIDAGIAVVAANLPIGPRTDTAEPQVDGMAGSVVIPADQQARSFAELTAEACVDTDPCKVGYLGGTGDDAFDRSAIAELEALGDPIELVSSAGSDFMRNPAVAATRDFLQKDPDLNVITAVGDQPAAGAEIAARDAGKLDQLKIIGGGASETGVDRVRDGTWFGTVLALPRDTGRNAMEIALAAARGEPVENRAVNVDEVSGLPEFMSQMNLEEFEGFEAQWEG